ncbi:uncharacterized protein PHACADRAFT_202746 [Phanerochaete carnosa HHB-10118-sp]|uniref:Uncharacterized protein n=1 Tax=Phanerochaete carnosa (strain HHB-10118-sp) TaxID=650164 RepID=K5VBL3_PHACS|nr:uncharacterized protein PHACADRAFT_202746 [Phanerochaete carnosa HHB-10118-sp]EKM48493.1 hypothetical protein PHACADRAFT_202746 [Phanerochaete carnosa HHB-10118-sp]
MPSASSATAFRDELEQFANANSSPPGSPRQPATVLGKRIRPAESTNDTSPTHSTAQPAASTNTVNRNVLKYAKRLGAKTKLRAEQQEKLNSFATDSSATQEMKTFSLLLAIQQRQDEFITMQAPWEPSDELIANIRNYTMGVLLSSRLATYKGVVPNNYVMGILKRYQFDLPADIERNHGRWSKVIKAIQNEMTEQRAKIKKTCANACLT